MKKGLDSILKREYRSKVLGKVWNTVKKRAPEKNSEQGKPAPLMFDLMFDGPPSSRDGFKYFLDEDTF